MAAMVQSPSRFVLLCAFLLAPAAALGAGWEAAPRAFVTLRDARPAALAAFADRLEAAGGHASVIHASGAAVIYAEDAVLARPEVGRALAGVFRSQLDGIALAALDPDRRQAGAAWNFGLTLDDPEVAPEAGPPAGLPGPPLPDAGRRPVALASRAGPALLDASPHAPYGAGYYDTSEFLAGRVAVGVWLLEAPGPGLDWSASEINQTLGGVQAGLDNWVRKGGAPAFLTFFVETHAPVTVSGTPIQNPISKDEDWVDEVLGGLGFPGANGFEKCFAYNHSIRESFGASWCYSIFIADSNPSVNQGLFSGGGYAWAYYGGPWVYMSRYSTWAYSSSSYFAAVPMHETGHIFMDTDEYDGTVQHGGYLGMPDSDMARCIMNRNDTTTVCPATRNQLGWRDLDGNGIIEPLDVPPVTSLAPAPDPAAGAAPAWSGRAQVATLANQNPLSNYQPPHRLTIARIAAVECRVDGGPWSGSTASDGAFDGYGEDFTWTPAPLAPGTHVIEARALTTAGRWSTAYASDTVSVGGVVAVEEAAPAGATFALFPPEPNPAVEGTTLRFTLPAPGPVRLMILGVDGRRVRLLLDGERPAGPSRLAWDGREDSGRIAPPGVYWCRIESRALRAVRRLAVVR